jgi:hypothetical protein
MSTQVDPFGVLTEEAEFFDVPNGDLDEYLPPFAAGLVMVAGRALAQLAYRDADRWADRTLDRADATTRGTVLALMPPECDGQDRAFRMRAARAFWDLAEDLASGRAPLPRCAAETWALEVMLQQAPKMCAAPDAELGAWGVAIPDGDADSYYGQDFEEQPWMLLIEGAEYSIPEARAAAEAAEEAEAEPAEGTEPETCWSSPAYWFSPYGVTAPRDPARGHAARNDSAPRSAGPASPERAEELLRLGEEEHERDEDSDGRVSLNDTSTCGSLAEVLTPQAASLLAFAADQVAEQGWHDVFCYGDRVVERPADEDDDGFEDSFLMDLPPLCDGQSAAWRLAMVRAVENLAGDLRAGRAPIPTCTAEELAFHLVLREAEVVLDYLEDDDYAHGLGLPSAREFSVRHRTFERWRDHFLQDEDVLMHYDESLQHVATDPDPPASLQLGTGDLRPRAWFAPFGNVRPRPARGLEPWLQDQISTADPEAFFASTPALRHEPLDHAAPKPVALPEGLREEFETFVGLGQRRFFDESTAVAMASSLDRLLTLFFSVPQVVPFRIWPLNPRAAAVKAGLLIVDHDFCLRGLEHTWRLRSDQTDSQARKWATDLLLDCGNYALTNYDRGPWSMLRDPDEAAPEPVDPTLAETLLARLRDLARDMTAAGLLRHRMDDLGLTTAELAALAVLPEPLVASWLDGVTVSPSQVIRCAPALQMSEDVLLEATGGKRDTEYWALSHIRW